MFLTDVGRRRLTARSTIGFLAVTLVAMFPAAGGAAPITFFSSSTSSIGSDTTGSSQSAPYFQRTLDATGSPTGTSVSQLLPEGLAEASSSADLLTGALTGYTKVDAAGLPLANALDAFSRADIGDSFRTYQGSSPFTWSSSTATFEFDVSGSINLAGAVNGSGFGLFIFQPGALDPYARWLNGENTFSQWSSQVIQNFDYVLGPGPLFPGSTRVSSFPTTVTASFTPGTDFDWAIYFYTNAHLSFPALGNGANFGVVDFAHTIGYSYAGPAGTTTYSASGLTPGTSPLNQVPAPVPEPGSMLLLGSGLVGLVASHRRRRRRA